MIIIGIIILVLFVAFAIVITAYRPVITLYALAFVVSVVGINIHIGVTFYLSRIVLIIFLISLLLRTIKASIKLIWVQIPLISLLIQFVSVLLSDHISEGLRAIFIYACLAFIFITVIILGAKTEVIIKAVKIYLLMGIIQGLYGIYQLIGGARHWPTYQTLMAGIPMANDRTIDGYFYSGSYSTFRAIGFFSSDVSHFAGYMAGILLLAITFIIYNRRSLFPYLVLLFGGAGLLFSLSRSGILAFLAFGLPSLFYFLKRTHLLPKFKLKSPIKLIAIAAIVNVALIFVPLNIPNPLIILSSRFENIVDPGSSSSESMSEHVITRETGLDALLSSPVLGVGPGVNAAPWYSERYRRYWAGSHSYHFDILGQTGLLGAITEWLLMVLIVLYMIRGLKAPSTNKQAKFVLVGLLSTYITIIFGNFFYYYYLNDFVWFIMGCGIALSRAIILEGQRTILPVSQPDQSAT